MIHAGGTAIRTRGERAHWSIAKNFESEPRCKQSLVSKISVRKQFRQHTSFLRTILKSRLMALCCLSIINASMAAITITFFHEVETKFIENDEVIQLRPLEPKILPLLFNLKQAVQLLPSLGRIDPQSKTVQIFDGQHKAVAQIVGNNRSAISCFKNIRHCGILIR